MSMPLIPSSIMQAQGFHLHWTAVFIVFINHLTSHGWCSTTPPRSDALTLNVTNNGPGIFDSNISFTAVLSYPNGTIADKGLYNYSWQHDAQILHALSDPEYTEGFHNSSFDKIIPKYNLEFFPVPAGNYTMYVNIWPKTNGTEPAANGSTVFTMTDTLNMDLLASQYMGVPLPPNTFCTCKNITLTAIAQDEFTHAKYEYTWKIPGQKKLTTTDPMVSIKLPSVGNQTLQTEITATVYEDNGVVNTLKKGNVTLNITLLDGLHCTFSKEPNLLIGNQLQANFTCTGSPPYTICANITAPDASLNKTCKNFTTSRNGFLSLDYYVLQQSGAFELSISAVNIVSGMDFRARVDVGGVPQSAGVIIGCLFVALFVMVIVGYAYYYDLNHREGRSEETADFNFHPWHHSQEQATDSKVSVFLQNMRQTLAVRVAASRHKYDEWCEQRRQKAGGEDYIDEEEGYTQPSAPSYGSENSSVHSYGSISTVDA